MTRREAIAHALERWAPNAEDHEVDRFEDVLRAAGFVVVEVPPEVDHMDAPGHLSPYAALGWAAGFNHLRAMLEAAP